MTETPRPTAFLGIDLETTGLSPEDDYILEVGWKLLTRSFSSLSSTQSAVVTPTRKVWRRIQQDSLVYDMHEKSGLLKDLEKDTLPLEDIEDLIINKMVEAEKVWWNSPEKGVNWHLIGSSVHFDKVFIDKHMPLLSEKLHYRILDVSSIELFMQGIGMPVERRENPGKHRAMSDLHYSLLYLEDCEYRIDSGDSDA